LITLRKIIFGREKEEATEGWMKLRTEELHNLYSWCNIMEAIESNRMRLPRTGEMRNAIGQPEGRRSLGGLRHRWEGNI
jgi:hypothetical protein